MDKNIRYCHDPNREVRSLFFDHVHIFWHEQLSLHQQRTWELSYVITGQGVRIIGDLMCPFSQGEVILIPPNMPHCWSFDESVCDNQGRIENITITFTDDYLKDIGIVFPELAGCVSTIRKSADAISFRGETLDNLQRVMKGMVLKTNAERISSFIELLTLISYSHMSNVVGRPVVEDRQTKRIQDIYLFVLNNYQHNITLDEIAKHVNMEKSSFCVFFKKMTGNSFFSFLTEYRIESSCHMLAETGKSVAEISFASGFRDIPYYNRMFKKIKNTTPTQFRKSFRSEN